MKKLTSAIALIAALYVGWGLLNEFRDSAHVPASGPASAEDALVRAFRAQQSGVQVTGEGVVTRILPDDNDGGRHQRFILRLPSGQTLLIAHNIDLAPRVASLASGDSVQFSGVYEWNPQGGVVHWTHLDPDGSHQAGWLRHNGKMVQ